MEKEKADIDIVRPRIPVSAYRLQISRDFGFSGALKIIPYLHELGITDIYSSPYFKARSGSLHGYDIVDHGVLNPDVGTETEYDALCEELKKYGMGQVLDIVPNHMCIVSGENSWWMDVLENGRSSVYAEYFDIDWEPVKAELRNKVLLPVLGDQYGKVLENQELKLSFEGGAFFVYYFDYKFPIMPLSYIRVLEYGLEEFKGGFSSDDPQLAELLSIVTAIRNLPSETETDPLKVEERYREKEIVKKRLLKLHGGSTAFRGFIDENVKIFNGQKGEPGSFDQLEALLREQVYRLSHWRVATDEINYRRFFDINDLGAIRMEIPRVFKDAHRLILKLVAEGRVTGLRVDHIDGLYDPPEYLRQLQAACCSHAHHGPAEKAAGLPATGPPATGEAFPDVEADLLRQCNEAVESGEKPFYIVGEKILVKGEKLNERWPIFGTTGYDFLNALNGIFVDVKNSRAFDKIYERLAGGGNNFFEVVYEKKKLVMQVVMSSEISTLGRYLSRIAEKKRHTRDFTLNGLTGAVVEVIAFFPVYRTYINGWEVGDSDRQHIELAVSKAKRKNPAINGSIFDFLRDVLLLRSVAGSLPADFEDSYRGECLDFVKRLQQLTGPVMAKGLEDTAFYIYNRLASLNEVGGMPERFGMPIEAFHGQGIERLKSWPYSFSSTSSHDCKRSEDVRARINVLSEIPDRWRDALIRWRKLNKSKKIAVEGRLVPDPNEEYFLYQSLIGAWPVAIADGDYGGFKKRIIEYMLKAVREAKVNTSWINPDPAYEDSVAGFIESLMRNPKNDRFMKDFLEFQRSISHFGMFNSLSQVLLKIASPGIPEFYQGAEIWNLSLVDPDNRRPVDYDLLVRLLGEIKSLETSKGAKELVKELTANKDDGRIKLYITYKALNFRGRNKGLFETGDYLPLAAVGEKSDNVCSFARRLDEKTVITVVPRYFTRLLSGPEGMPLGGEVWKDDVLSIPFGGAGEKYLNIFSGEEVETKSRDGAIVLNLSEVFASAPVALLEKAKSA